MLTQTAEYALRAVLFLPGPSAGRPASVDEIAGALDIPGSYLSKILQELSKAEIVLSSRGRTGGYRLAVPGAQLHLARVVNVFEAQHERRHCLLGRGPCSDRTPCAAHHAWKGTAAEIDRFFEQTTVADIQGPLDGLRRLA